MNIYKFFISTIKKCKLFFFISCIMALFPEALSSYGYVYYAKILSFGFTEPPFLALAIYYVSFCK